jgi:hypothetical protein
MAEYTKQHPSLEEIQMYEEVLDKIADTYNPTFRRLILPKSIKTDKGNLILIMPDYTAENYEGETFNSKWNVALGGSEFGNYLADEIPDIVFDLSVVDTSIVYENEILKQSNKLEFRTDEYLNEFKDVTDLFCKHGQLNNDEVAKAERIVSKAFPQKTILSNADFYPRNFIRLPTGKIVLIDWDTWSSRQYPRRCKYVLDHIENVAAHCFVHMWDNSPWQQIFVQQLRIRFTNMQPEDFQRALLINSLGMAHWFGVDGNKNLKQNGPEINDISACQKQLILFKEGLKDEFIIKIWGK